MKRSIHHLRSALVLTLSLVVVSAAIRQFTPAPFLRHVTPKLMHLGSNFDKYEILFVGSSRVYRQISPRVFDEHLRSRDLDLPSFNLGVPAAKSVEVWHLLRELATDRRVRARYVLIEPDGLLIGIARENMGNQREIYWHGRTETGLAIASLDGLSLGPRARMTGLHLGSHLLNRLSVGRLRLLGSQLGRADELRWMAQNGLGPDGDGWVPFAKADNLPEFERRREFLENLPKYQWKLKQQPERHARRDCLSAYHSAMLSKLKDAVEALGAEPVFILSPTTDPRCEVHHAFREGQLPHLIALDDALEFPELYAVENRHDYEHLNTDGALLYSRLLADRFADHIQNVRRGGGT